MVAAYSFMLGMQLHINVIIVIFGLLVALLMCVLIYWNKINHIRQPHLNDVIGAARH